MKTAKILCAALLVMAAVSAPNAFAGDGGDGGLPAWSPYVSSNLSRADVETELVRTRKAGGMTADGLANPEGEMFKVSKAKTRAEVDAETEAARKANGGTLPTP